MSDRSATYVNRTKNKKPIKKSSKQPIKKKQTKSPSKSKGSNIQIHIDLSKRKTIGPRTSNITPSTQKQTQPQINLPPPVYGMSAPSQSSSSMNEALNLLLANHLGYEKAHRNGVKRENPITKDDESITSFGDRLNKSVGFFYPEEEEFNTENPELEEKYYSSVWSSPMKKAGEEEEEEFQEVTFPASKKSQKKVDDIPEERPLMRNTMVPNIELSRMKLNELQELAISRGIDILKEGSQITQGKGKGYKPIKNRQQLIEELTRL